MRVGPSSIHAQWTAWAYGHPRDDAIRAMLGGVSGTRPTPDTYPVSPGVHRFEPLIDKAIYATGWDGDIVITADKDGVYTVVSHPVVHPRDPPHPGSTTRRHHR